MPFADNIRTALDRAGVSQSELARRLNIRSQAVNQWLQPGGTTPRGIRLVAVADALGVDLSELLGKPPSSDQTPANPLARCIKDDSHAAAEAQRLFAAALREARVRYGQESGQGPLTQKEFAKMLGISGDRPEERYRLYEKGNREPPLWILAAVRRVTGYSLDDLIAQLPAGRRLDHPRTQPSGKPQSTSRRPAA